MIFGQLFPEMVGAALSLYAKIKTTEFTEEVLDKLCPIKHLAQDCAEELFRAYCELRSKDGEALAFICAYPEYARCDDNVWHGAIDGKIAASRQIAQALNRTDRYSCGEKLRIMREGLNDFICDGVTQSVTACNFEYTLEDTYYEEKHTFLANSASGSPSSLIAAGFGSAADILLNVTGALQAEQQGAAAAFGVFGRRTLDALAERSTQSREPTLAPVSEIRVNPAPAPQVNVTVTPDQTFPLNDPQGRIIETERFSSSDDSFIK